MFQLNYAFHDSNVDVTTPVVIPRAPEKRGGRLHNYRVNSLGIYDNALVP
ncbi:hypothetical protein CLAFUW4_02939 [Fulvia fulva]|nr:hypothetical protein CLAFUR4_02932 [Fulvia fulva]KAK4633523.1 hypothetical protein CLAFUR0_02935 [Fulvia fulva]WPV11315.1 hypothetical protein CLAFUW4_02939 [Fulvia fulva]WPV26921.1 hypothetical protein CLAFUW7_02936 [Fulvia fulva]